MAQSSARRLGTIPSGCRMRHPLLRVFLALLIGVWSPLCCCQAAALVGTTCGMMTEPRASADLGAADSCCQCCDDEEPPGDGALPSDPGEIVRAGSAAPGAPVCPTCQACQGSPVSAALHADAKIATVEQHRNALVTLGWAVLPDVQSLRGADAGSAPPPAWWWCGPPHLKANRDAQRWHCALVI